MNIANTGTQGDFLEVDVAAAEWETVTAVMLDPSCTGSGTALSRMDFLLPSTWQTGDAARQAAAAEVSPTSCFGMP